MLVGGFLELLGKLEDVWVDLVAIVASEVPQRLLRRCEDTRVKRLDPLAKWGMVGNVSPSAAVSPALSAPIILSLPVADRRAGVEVAFPTRDLSGCSM